MAQPSVARSQQRKGAGRHLLPASILFIALMTLLPSRSSSGSSQLCIVCGELGGVDVVLNVLLFVPLGAALALRGWPWRGALLAAGAFTLGIELLQLRIVSGRDASIGDLLMNSLGGALGYWIAFRRQAWLRPSPPAATRLAAGVAAAWLATQVVTAVALQPALTDDAWFGQMRRRIRAFAPFEARVGEVTVGSLPLPEHRVDRASVASALRRGDVVRAALVPGPRPWTIAPIYRIADGSAREILLVGRRGQDFVFRVRTNASALRLRPPTFALFGAFPPGAAAEDSVRVEARLLEGAVWLRATGDGGTVARTVASSASWGWVLVLPFQMMFTSPFTTAGTVVWLVTLLAPAGYWAAFARCGRRGSLVPMAGGGALLVAGLLVIPVIAGFHVSPLTEWLAAAAGLIGGWLVGSRRAASTSRHGAPLAGHPPNPDPA